MAINLQLYKKTYLWCSGREPGSLGYPDAILHNKPYLWCSGREPGCLGYPDATLLLLLFRLQQLDHVEVPLLLPDQRYKGAFSISCYQ
jgi:hypothetical protein